LGGTVALDTGAFDALSAAVTVCASLVANRSAMIN
jgi:hypothetical protein